MLETLPVTATLHHEGRELAITHLGDDIPVLLIPDRSDSFADFLDPRRGAPASWLAARGCRVIGFDRVPGGEVGPAERTRDALAVLEAANAWRAAVIGIGSGAQIALRCAAQARERINCVVADSVQVGEQRRDGDGAPPEAPLGLTGAELDRVRCPVLLVRCGPAGDPQSSALYDLARRLPEAHVALLPGDRSPACWNAPGFFFLELERFLAAFA